jgi:hypothetical protein
MGNGLEAVRTAANKARGMGKILSPFASDQVKRRHFT